MLQLLVLKNLTSSGVYVGGAPPPWTGDGKVDDVGVFNRTLLAVDIQTLYALGAAKHGIALNTR